MLEGAQRSRASGKGWPVGGERLQGCGLWAVRGRDALAPAHLRSCPAAP